MKILRRYEARVLSLLKIDRPKTEKSILQLLVRCALYLVPLWLALFALIILALVRTAIQLFTVGSADLRWIVLAFVGLMTALGGLVGVPLAFLRIWTTERQTHTAEQGHITDRINAAVRNLGEDKVVHRLARLVEYVKDGADHSRLEFEEETCDPLDPDFSLEDRPIIKVGPWTSHQTTQPNLEVRIGAIYALARIAEDSARDHVQIMKILCAYIRQNAPAPPEEDNPHHVFRDLVYPKDGSIGLCETTAWNDKRFQKVRSCGSGPKDMTVENMVVWTNTLPPRRLDIQTALTLIARRADAQIRLERPSGSDEIHPLDLRGTDLRRADLDRAKFDNVLLDGARLEGANLGSGSFVGANLQGAHLGGAQLSHSNLSGANMRESFLEGAECLFTVLDKSYLDQVTIAKSVFRGAVLQNNYLRNSKLLNINIHLARLEGTDFSGAKLESVGLYRGDNKQGNLLLRGAALRRLDLSRTTEPSFKMAFGDASVSLPDGFTAGEGPLSHWSPEKLDREAFDKAWRKWQPENHPDLLPDDHEPKA